MSGEDETRQGTADYDAAARCRALAVVNLRESDAAWSLAERTEQRDPGLAVFLKEMALQAQGTARAAAVAACAAEGGYPGELSVRLLAGRVETGFGDKASIAVPGQPETLTWHSGDIAGQTGIPVAELDGRVVSFVAEEDGDDARLYGFEAVTAAAGGGAAPGSPARGRAPGEREGRARRREPPGGSPAPRRL